MCYRTVSSEDGGNCGDGLVFEVAVHDTEYSGSLGGGAGCCNGS